MGNQMVICNRVLPNVKDGGKTTILTREVNMVVIPCHAETDEGTRNGSLCAVINGYKWLHLVTDLLQISMVAGVMLEMGPLVHLPRS
jgi:hypothetical protein